MTKMIFILSFIGALIWFLFVLVLIHFSQSPEAQLRKRLNSMIDTAERLRKPRQIKNPTPAQVQISDGYIIETQRETLYQRVIPPLIRTIEERLQKLAPNAIKEQIEEKIFLAGKTGSWSVSKLVTWWCLSIGIFVIGALVFTQQHSGINPLQKILFVLVVFFIGSAIPFAILNARIRKRQKIIRRQLPEFLDILCVSVQAGLSFDGAISKMIKRMDGPLIDEFKRMQHDVSLGMTRQYALTNLATRCGLEEIYLFTASVIQSERLGTSITRTLKTQADNMRERHKQWIKAEALKAPVKILFPMIFFIFPSMFVILLFPALFSFIQNFSNR